MSAPSRAVAILGFGRFGRALSGLLTDAGRRVCAFDPAADVPKEWRAASLEELVRDADEVVLAIPAATIPETMEALRPHLEERHLVVDVASVKHGSVRDLTATLGRDFAWVATHPLFGPTSISLNERPLIAVVCPNPLHPDAAARARSLFESIGCEVVEQDATSHDRAMAATHAMAFFVARGLMELGAGDDARFVPPSFRAMARMIDAVRSDANHLFTTIQNDNPFAAEARARLLAALTAIDRDLAGVPASADTGPERTA